MKRLRMVLVCLFVANFIAALVASAKGILPCMVYRYGLTNEQMDDLLDKHPNGTLRITAQDWRAMRYQLHRFDCMTNYVTQIGSTQDCARVLLELRDSVDEWRTRYAATSNLYAKAERNLSVATENLRVYEEVYTSTTNSYFALLGEYTVATNRASALSAAYVSATNSLSVAQARAARADNLKSWLEDQRDKSPLQTTKKIYQTIIDRLEGGE